MAQADFATLADTYICTLLAMMLISVRLIWRFCRGERMYTDDVWMGVSLGPLLIRLGMVHVALVYGTNNIDYKGINVLAMSEDEINRRVIGSKLVLASRILYAGFLWCMKICILGFYERLTARSKPYGLLINITYFTCLITFIGVILVTVLECRPFHVYWQMIPYPGHCVMGVAQLITMGTFNIFTDIMLICIPLPIVFRSRLPLFRKLQLLLLFGLGFFVVAITIIRVPIIISDKSAQKARTLWASIECLVACIVANAPVLNSLIQKVRKQPFDYDQYRLNSAYAKRRRMPIIGQDSVGSLTRSDEFVSVIETRTDVVQKIDINLDHDETTSQPRSKQSPWRGDFLGTQIWTETEEIYPSPAQPPPVAGMEMDQSESV